MVNVGNALNDIANATDVGSSYTTIHNKKNHESFDTAGHNILPIDGKDNN